MRFVGLASPTCGEADLCTWRITVDAGLVSPQWHSLDRDGVFMVTAGEVRLTPDGPLVRAGDAAVIPAGSPIRVEHPGDSPAEAFVAVRTGFSAVAEEGSPIGRPQWAR